MTILIKIHKSSRIVVAVCDSDLIGKRFEEDIRQLDMNGEFFKGQEYSQEEAVNIMRNQIREDATFNIVGEKSIDAALKSGAINESIISKIQSIPFALRLI